MASKFLERAERGAAALDALDRHKPPSLAPELEWEWASDELAGDPPDELVQGFLVRSGISLLYGESNSGKTFLALDLAAAIGRGVEWFGRQVEPGLVFYLACESPASPRTRLRAYREAFNCVTPNIVIVTTPVDFFSDDRDKDELIRLIGQITAKTGKTCQLIVVDTLARVSAGANENSGEDMGLIIGRVDALRAATGAHTMLIHHAGKDHSKGARGWSGIKAAVDTEIEVTTIGSTGLRRARVTKQRDLPGKGSEITFRLQSVDLGTTKWGESFTSCVLEQAGTPSKELTRQRTSEIAAAIMDTLKLARAPVKEVALVKSIQNAHAFTRTAVYNQIKKLVIGGELVKTGRMLTVAASAQVDLSSLSSPVVDTTNDDKRQNVCGLSSMSSSPHRGDDNDDNTETEFLVRRGRGGP